MLSCLSVLWTLAAFEEELDSVLPNDLPERQTVIRKAARHLESIEETNQLFNLTRITGPAMLPSNTSWIRFCPGPVLTDRGACSTRVPAPDFPDYAGAGAAARIVYAR